MNEIYWISVLANIGTFGTIFLVISSIIGIVSAVAMAAYKEDNDEIPESISKTFKISVVVFIWCLVVEIFIPSKKEMYTIWGVGYTIDYIRNNDTAKHLPDKCINALDKWVDNWAEKSDSTKTKE